jgi:hypothetical protein
MALCSCADLARFEGAQSMSRYSKHISTSWLQNLRWEVIGNRAGGVCENCHKAFATQVHHLRYPAGRREEARDLMAVCDRCHHLFHYPVAANDNFEQDEFDL